VVAALGEGWIADGEAVARPFGLAVADEDYFHVLGSMTPASYGARTIRAGTADRMEGER
jgi:hypothetical protein